jgi:type II secretory pathway predicted ATPase ExeA
MYLDFYGLGKEPFQVTPDPEFIYLSESHKEALASIIYGTEQKKGFVAITGAVGAGKTTVLRFYLSWLKERPDGSVKTIYVLNPNLSFHDLVRTIYQDLGIEPAAEDLFLLVDRLHHILVEEYKSGNTVVLIVDEAQDVPVETLENLRLLSNLETATDKLIQIILVGQPELDEMLMKYELRQLRQRIAVRATISPLTVSESRDYITHRLMKAGLKGRKAIFSSGARRNIVKRAEGIPRAINIICDNSLITGYGYNKRPVTAAIVKEVIADLKVERKGEVPLSLSPEALPQHHPEPAEKKTLIAEHSHDKRPVTAAIVKEVVADLKGERKGEVLPAPETLPRSRPAPAGKKILITEHGYDKRPVKAAIARDVLAGLKVEPRGEASLSPEASRPRASKRAWKGVAAGLFLLLLICFAVFSWLWMKHTGFNLDRFGWNRVETVSPASTAGHASPAAGDRLKSDAPAPAQAPEDKPPGLPDAPGAPSATPVAPGGEVSSPTAPREPKTPLADSILHQKKAKSD